MARYSTPTSKLANAVTVAFSGDVLVHTAVADRARANNGGTGFDFRPMLAPVRTVLSRADLAICHLETPLSPDNRNLSGYPIFNAPNEVAEALADAGYDACSTASNHAFDQGSAGVAATLDALDRVGVGHAGTARTADEASRASTFRAGGATVALLDYTYPGGVPTAAPPWAVRRIDPAAVLAEAASARRDGADLVVVTLHWGEEYRTAPTAQQS
nr:CapA family protein [Micromonospora sp. DSM 115978]